MAISVKEATLISIVVEGILYGFSAFLFGITLWSLTYRRSYAEVARLMVAAACLLFILGTMHIVVDANHLWQGFISAGGADAYFNDVSKDTFKNALYEVETLVADAILIYRCYVVWRRIDVIIVPIIGWMAVVVTSTHAVWSIKQLSAANANIVFMQETGQWVISFYSMALATNAVTTSILAFKIWLVHRRSSAIIVTRSRVYPVLLMIMECGVLYSLSLLTMLVTYVSASNSAYIVIDMIGQIIPITFFLIIVRTAMLRFSSDGASQHTGASDRVPVARNMRVQIDRVRVVDSDIGVSPVHTDSKMYSFHEA